MIIKITKYLCYIVCFTLCWWFLIDLFSTNSLAYITKYTIKKIEEEKIIIDGDLSDWNTQEYSIQVSSSPAQFDYNNFCDVWIKWNDKYLYIAVKVEDEQLWADTSEKNAMIDAVTDDDNIEVYLNRYNLPQSLQNNLFYIKIDLGGEIISSTFGNCQDSKDILYKVKVLGTINNNADKDKGFSIELAIPWEKLGGTPTVGESMSLALVNCDDDMGGSNHTWSVFPPGMRLNNSNTFSEILFCKSTDSKVK